jgi:hypothetical protein
MANAIVTPGYVFAPNEIVTYAKLNLEGQPTVQLPNSGVGASLNYFHNGNFYGPGWLTPAGVSVPPGVETFNASQWSVISSGAAVTYAQSAVVPNVFSLYSAQITGATSATAISFNQNIPADLSVSLDTTISVGMYIKNVTGASLTPTLTVYSCNTINNYTALTAIYSQSLSIIANNTWLFETASFNLSGLSNVQNGLKFSITFPSGSLNSGAKSVNISQAILQIGSSNTAFFDDLSYFPPPSTPQLINSQIGYTPLFTSRNNLVLNGNADVWQESNTYTQGTGTIQVADGWKYTSAGTMAFTVSQNTTAGLTLGLYNPSMANSLKVAITTAEASLGANDLIIVKNSIEGYNFAPCANAPLCLQFWVRSSTIGQYSVGISNVTDHVIYYTYNIATANTWQQVIINGIPAPPIGSGTWNFTSGIGLQLSWTLAAGASQQSINPGGVWYASVIPTFTGQTNLAATNSNTWEVTGVQLEPGNSATPLLYRPFSDMIWDCQRYYWKSFPYASAAMSAVGVIGLPSGTLPGFLGLTAVSTSLAAGHVKFTRSMRAVPTAQTYNWNTGGVATVFQINSGSSIGTAPTAMFVSADGFSEVSFGSGATVGNIIAIHAYADARL